MQVFDTESPCSLVNGDSYTDSSDNKDVPLTTHALNNTPTHEPEPETAEFGRPLSTSLITTLEKVNAYVKAFYFMVTFHEMA